MLRNREEYLLKKKNQNVVDEMQLGLIKLERTYEIMRGLAQKVFDETIEKERRKRGIPEYAPKQHHSREQPAPEEDEVIDEDIEFK